PPAPTDTKRSPALVTAIKVADSAVALCIARVCAGAMKVANAGALTSSPHASMTEISPLAGLPRHVACSWLWSRIQHLNIKSGSQRGLSSPTELTTTVALGAGRRQA